MTELKERPGVYETETREDGFFRTAAIRRLKKQREFRSHLFVYLVVNAALWTIWAVDGAVNDFDWPWPAIATFFWGLFILGDAYDSFWKKPISEQEIEREAARLKGYVVEPDEDDWPC